VRDLQVVPVRLAFVIRWIRTGDTWIVIRLARIRMVVGAAGLGEG
jgi:hypothetical protein